MIPTWRRLFRGLNIWYDNLQEPWRLLLIVIMTMIWSFGLSYDNPPWIFYLSAVIFTFQVGWALSRI